MISRRVGVSASRRLGVGMTLAFLMALPSPIGAQHHTHSEFTTVVPGPQYRAGSFKRSLLGSEYRDLWTTPIRVPTLDLRRFGGGLTPTQEGGGQQTTTLRLKGADGREYQFRSVDKDGAGALPEGLRGGVAAAVVRDQTSSSYPAGSVLVPPLLKAAGLLHAPPILVRMPDDSGLGEFREKFAGMLGTIEERPDSGWAGASEVLDTEDLFARLDREPRARVAAREFLTARLIDLVVGDWDRTRDQWRWARFGNTWRPIPRDRDAAFSRYDGMLLWAARMFKPRLVKFDAGYPDLKGMTQNGQEIDRRLLSGLERETWDSVARWLRGTLNDSVLEAAVRAAPTEFPAQSGAWLLDALKTRRDHLEDLAEHFYRRLARIPEVTATDEPEHVRIEREPSGSMLVTITHGEIPLFRRRFLAWETSEVRLFLRGGDDRIELEAGPETRGAPRIRVVGGAGDDRYTLSGSSSGFRLYDEAGDNTVAGGIGLDRKSWPWDADTIWYTHRPRDRGFAGATFPLLEISRDVGVALGLGARFDWHGFRRIPYESRLTLGAEYATARQAGRFSASFTRQLENSPVFFRISGLASGIEALNWYGFGNETEETQPSTFYRVRMNEYRAGLAVGTRFGDWLEISAGPVALRSSTALTSDYNAVRFIGMDQPYGVRGFKMAGVAALLRLEARDYPGFARRGAALVVRGDAYPGWLDADSAVVRIEAQGSVAFAPVAIADRRPSLHLMAGGAKTWGKLPFFLAPTLGGSRRLRGYNRDRFAGDASLFGSVEVRLPVTRATILVPGEQGLFGFYDVGKVLVRGEASDVWHRSLGAGVWLSFYRQDYVMYLAVAWPDRREEGTRVLFGLGFPY